MNGMIRLTAAVNRVHCANAGDCLEEIRAVLAQLPGQGEEVDIVVFPQLALSSPSCGALFQSDGLLDACSKALEELMRETAEMSSYIIVGLPVDDFGRTASVMAVLCEGELVALIQTTDNPPPLAGAGYSDNLVPAETVFSCGRLRFCVLGCELGTLPLRAAAAAATGCDLIIVPAYSPVYAGRLDEVVDAVRVISKATGCAIAVVNGGVGDTSAPFAFAGLVAIFECGEQIVVQQAGGDNLCCTADLDVDIIRAGKRVAASVSPSYQAEPATDKPGILRTLRKNPWLPEGREREYLAELFELQARSLATRMENIGAARLVLGVSGGIDSTAALLASVAACDRLGLPRENVIAITMPGFGTSDRTYYNALALMEKLGVTKRDIPIRAVVQQHLEDIGHAGKRDTVYENAQARARSQVLLDVANDVGGFVVGSGDLSEAALGFCTFGGDHLANYNVNICIAKTLLRELVRWVAVTGRIDGIAELAQDILDTPVSPELLPPDKAGDIQQRTEEIIGPYPLHDFFLYYFARYRLRPAKIFTYACAAFEEYPPALIRETLRVFYKRFCAGQFKRACAPDAASITEVNLNAIHFQIPSDLSSAPFLRELDETPDPC